MGGGEGLGEAVSRVSLVLFNTNLASHTGKTQDPVKILVKIFLYGPMFKRKGMGFEMYFIIHVYTTVHTRG